jgi:hypothetical protein
MKISIIFEKQNYLTHDLILEHRNSQKRENENSITFDLNITDQKVSEIATFH